jgi:SAM-dependent methyltransferase
MGERIPHDDWAQWYDLIYEATYGDAYRWLTDETLRAVQSVADPNSAVLDVGAATGRLTVPLAQLGHRVHAIDRSPAMLHRLLMRATTEGLGKHITTQCVSAHDMVSAVPFDLALCVFTVLLYLPDLPTLERTLGAISASLRVGGRLLVDVPRRDLFVGYVAETDAISRQVRISPASNDQTGCRFEYEDHVYLKAPFLVRIEERFDATWWPEKVVLEAAQRAGLELELDISDRFARAASAHWWLRRDR